MKNKQVTLTGTGFEKFSKTTRRAQFLAEMERVVPWAELCALVEPVYPKGEGGRPTIRFNLGDPAVEEALYDVVSMREFAGVDLNQEAPPTRRRCASFVICWSATISARASSRRWGATFRAKGFG
jgi:IS5 family transposase